MQKDQLYKDPKNLIEPFEFNAEVAAVFDDMLHRSIPFYSEIINRQAQLIKEYYQAGTRIYDLGCSQGNLGIRICDTMEQLPFFLVSVDNSPDMLNLYRKRIDRHPDKNQLALVCSDIMDVSIVDASVVVINFTLQFLPVGLRDSLVSAIFTGLHDDGILLFSEKTIHLDDSLNDLQQNFYYRFKKENGYSELEISQKREALENILIPETVEDHHKRLKAAGFRRFDIWHKWFNFSSWICQK